MKRAKKAGNQTRRGRLIVLEGGEGAGKSTWAPVIVNWLKRQGRSVILTREPGGSPRAEAIRGLLLKGHDNMSPECELLLMFAARVDHVRTLILPALQKGHDVVCDRFVDSSFAYQGAGRGLKRVDIARLESLSLGRLRPDLILVFDLPPEVGRLRVRKRGPQDRFEREPLAFQKRVRREFLRRARLFPQRYRLIDAARPLEAVRRQLLNVLEQTL